MCEEIKMKIDNFEKLSRIKAWQGSTIVHPLTCGGEGCHDVSMEPQIDSNGEVILICPQCGRTQHFIPYSCYSMSVDEMHQNEIEYQTKFNRK